MSEHIENFECFYAVVVKGRLKSLAQIRDYIIKFTDIYLVFDKTSPIKLYITEKPGGDKPK